MTWPPHELPGTSARRWWVVWSGPGPMWTGGATPRCCEFMSRWPWPSKPPGPKSWSSTHRICIGWQAMCLFHPTTSRNIFGKWVFRFHKSFWIRFLFRSHVFTTASDIRCFPCDLCHFGLPGEWQHHQPTEGLRDRAMARKHLGCSQRNRQGEMTSLWDAVQTFSIQMPRKIKLMILMILLHSPYFVGAFLFFFPFSAVHRCSKQHCFVQKKGPPTVGDRRSLASLAAVPSGWGHDLWASSALRADGDWDSADRLWPRDRSSVNWKCNEMWMLNLDIQKLDQDVNRSTCSLRNNMFLKTDNDASSHEQTVRRLKALQWFVSDLNFIISPQIPFNSVCALPSFQPELCFSTNTVSPYPFRITMKQPPRFAGHPACPTFGQLHSVAGMICVLIFNSAVVQVFRSGWVSLLFYRPFERSWPAALLNCCSAMAYLGATMCKAAVLLWPAVLTLLRLKNGKRGRNFGWNWLEVGRITTFSSISRNQLAYYTGTRVLNIWEPHSTAIQN